MKRIPLFGTGMLSKSPTVSAQRRVNCYFEVRQDEEKNTVVVYGTPGTAFALTIPGSGAIRGIYVAEVYLNQAITYLYAVKGSTVYQASLSGGTWTVVSLGSLPNPTGTGNVSMSDNGQQLFIVDNPNGYIVTISSGAIQRINIGATGILNNALSFTGTFLDGFFFAESNTSTTAAGRFYKSAAYDGTTWSTLDFATAESNPDLLLAIDSDHGYLVLFGQISIEFWQNAGTAGFPYVPIKSATAQWGLAARWSRAKFDNSIAFLAQNRQGQVQVMELNGYIPVPISTPDINNIINSMSNYTDAIAFSYMVDGHNMYQITFPTANRSFIYDNTSLIWSEVQTGVGTYQRHAAQFGVNYGQITNPTNSAFLNSIFIVSNAVDGQLCALTPGLNTDAITGSGNGQIERLIQTRHLEEDGNQFAIDEVFLDMQTGTAANGVTPKIIMQVSKDGGNTFGEERPVSIGMTGQYKGPRVTWRRLGAARDFVLRFKMTDAANFVITYGAAVKRGLGK